MMAASFVYNPRICAVAPSETPRNTPARHRLITVLSVRLLHASFLSPAPRNWAMRMPATVPTEPLTTLKIIE